MTRLQDRFDLAKQVPVPDLSSRVIDRLGGPGPEPINDEPRVGHRVLAGSIAIAIAVVAIGFAFRAFGSSTTPGSNGQPSLAVPADPCDLLTDADVEAATGSNVTSSGLVPKSLLKVPSYGPACSYQTDGSFGSIITRTNPSGATTRFAQFAADPNAESVSEVGDQAFVSGKSAIWVRVGDGYFLIVVQHGASDEAVAMLTALAHTAFDSLTSSPASSTTTLSTPCASDSPPPGFIGVWLPIPFVGAKRFETFSDAQDAAGADLGAVPLPSDSAGIGSITDVWIDPTKASTQICIDYASGIKVEYDPAIHQILDPSFARTTFEQMAREDAGSTSGQAQFVTIPGPGGVEVSGELIPDGAAVFANGMSQGGPGRVSFIASRYVVNVTGHGSSDSLTQIAASVIEDATSS